MMNGSLPRSLLKEFWVLLSHFLLWHTHPYWTAIYQCALQKRKEEIKTVASCNVVARSDNSHFIKTE